MDYVRILSPPHTTDWKICQFSHWLETLLKNQLAIGEGNERRLESVNAGIDDRMVNRREMGRKKRADLSQRLPLQYGWWEDDRRAQWVKTGDTVWPLVRWDPPQRAERECGNAEQWVLCACTNGQGNVWLETRLMTGKTETESTRLLFTAYIYRCNEKKKAYGITTTHLHSPIMANRDTS